MTAHVEGRTVDLQSSKHLLGAAAVGAAALPARAGGGRVGVEVLATSVGPRTVPCEVVGVQPVHGVVRHPHLVGLTVVGDAGVLAHRR